MKKKGIIIIIAILASSLCYAQDAYHSPESVVYNPNVDCYYVSNYGNYMVTVSDTSGIIDTLATGMSRCLGMHLLDNILYVSCNRYLKGISLATGTITFNKLIPATSWLDGMTSDSEGNLYVIDTSGKVYKIDPATGSYHVFASGFPNNTQDIAYDALNNRLLVVAWQNHSNIYAIDVNDSTSITNFPTTTGYFDGITLDAQGNVYVASHYGSDGVYKYDNSLSNPPEQIPGDFNEPAGLHYNIYQDILAVPNFAANTVDFINLATSVFQPVGNDELNLRGSSPNPFTAHTTLHFSLPKNDHISLSIYNIKGEFISQLVDGMYGKGEHTIEWNALDLKPGIYFCKLCSDHYSETKKITLLR